MRVVKFLGRKEPCIVYRVMDETQHILHNEKLNRICPHIKIEVAGMIPVEFLEDAKGHKKNTFAIDYMMDKSQRTN